MEIITHKITIDNISTPTMTCTHPWITYRRTYLLGFEVKKVELMAHQYYATAHMDVYGIPDNRGIIDFKAVI